MDNAGWDAAGSACKRRIQAVSGAVLFVALNTVTICAGRSASRCVWPSYRAVVLAVDTPPLQTALVCEWGMKPGGSSYVCAEHYNTDRHMGAKGAKRSRSLW